MVGAARYRKETNAAEQAMGDITMGAHKGRNKDTETTTVVDRSPPLLGTRRTPPASTPKDQTLPPSILPTPKG